MSKLFISRLAHDLFTICYEDKEGKSKAYKENWNPVSFASEQEAIDWLESIEKERSSADEAIALSSEEAEAFINKQEWIFASTCEKTNPHEYIVKKRLSESSQRKFERFVATIKTNPSVVVINGYSCSNFILGDHYYWIKEPYENVAAFLICRAKKLYLELKDGIYYYNAQKVQEDIKRREQWKKDLQEEMNRRSSLTSTKPHLSRNYIDAISSDGESDNDAYKPVPREMFQRTDKDAHRVLFGDLVWSNDFNLQVPLQVVIGKDINQAPVLGDISKMPNLLVAGGKSINCIDAILLSILCKASPRQVRFLMIDTGVTYLPRYEGIPHLIAPVVCDTALALDVLKWAESEINRRYELFSKKGVKDVSSYNRSLDTDEKPLPRLLIVVKDIVDLISVQRREILTVIMTLLSDWYPGIHLVLTTPKSHIELLPDELINLVAAKLVYGMSSSEDIKKILRCNVEDRSGHGEMIYAPLAAPIPIQCQGITVPDNDVFNAVDYLKRNYGTNYDPAVVKLIVGDQDNDPDIIFSDDTCFLKEFIDAMDAVILDGKISASMIQRRLGISYARAAAIIDEFEQRGYVGAFQGIKPRKVLIDESEWEEIKKNLMDNVRKKRNDG